jgi:hypothetical protein
MSRFPKKMSIVAKDHIWATVEVLSDQGAQAIDACSSVDKTFYRNLRS